MELTSKAANKLLKKLTADIKSLREKENSSSTFKASLEEDVESCRPEYSFKETRQEVEKLEMQVLKLKHAINKFNVETKLDGFDITIDQALAYLPTLNEKLRRLNGMINRLPKERVSLYDTKIIDYVYTNYDIDEVKKEYTETMDKIFRLQLALDIVNVKKTFTVEL